MGSIWGFYTHNAIVWLQNVYYAAFGHFKLFKEQFVA